MVWGWMRVASRIRRTDHPADSIERNCSCLSIRRWFPMGRVLPAPRLPCQPPKRITLGTPYVSGRESLWVSGDTLRQRISHGSRTIASVERRSSCLRRRMDGCIRETILRIFPGKFLSGLRSTGSLPLLSRLLAFSGFVEGDRLPGQRGSLGMVFAMLVLRTQPGLGSLMVAREGACLGSLDPWVFS